MERQSFPAETSFHWRLNSQLHIEQPSSRSHRQFRLLSSLELLLFPALYVRKCNIRSFSSRKDGKFLGWSWDLLCADSIHWQRGKYVRKSWLKHVYKMSVQIHCPKISPREQSKLLHNRKSATVTQDFTHNFFQSSLENPKLEMQTNNKGGYKQCLW